ncbi:electron transfer flavoprotein beta subunit [Paenibacillus sophorae]|uniref:Electron transfer flavoprotein small subunit n=1 Tax=Paenibacillus sophorae TaxID=1333845 RepID=A0A1H8KHQ0_9BACL|nr:electron transfer flavoprotein subunit beta/FixA family protein [Paenibacillus sophorae]QWU13747.1 electron transfer flavoprotein subunit beta/FixA family protein [Paenibacillus sophorae]SEN92347.1 electron transfer flavoprotein beta subunit [Paenibacillus sophorae]
MNVIVCVKPVVRDDGHATDGLSHYDHLALNFARQIKITMPCKVVAVAMSNRSSIPHLKKLKYKEVDEVVLISDELFTGSDTYATAYIMASAIQKFIPYDLIICGKKSLDGGTSQVPIQIAGGLNIPHISYVNSIEIEGSGYVHATRKLYEYEAGVRVKLPCLITVDESFSVRQYISLSAIQQHFDYHPRVISNNELGLDPSSVGASGSLTKVIRSKRVNQVTNCRFLERNEYSQIAGMLNHV